MAKVNAITVRESDIRDLQRLLWKFTPAENRKIMRRAASTAVRDSKSSAVKRAAGALATKSRRPVSQAVKHKLSRAGGRVTIYGTPIQAHQFTNRLVGRTTGPGSDPVGTQWYKDTSLKKREGAWRMHRRKYSRSPIFRRVGTSRLPVKQLFGPTPFDPLASGSKGQQRLGDLTEFGGDKYVDELSRQIDLVLRGA